MKKAIFLSVATMAILTLSGCGDQAKEGSKSVVDAAKDAVSKTVDSAKEATAAVADKAKEATSATVDAAKEAAAKTTEAVKDTATKAVDTAKEATSATVDAAKEAAAKTTEAVKDTATKAVDTAKEAASATADATGGNDKGKAVFNKCAGCHGADGKTKALGKSEIIAGQSAADLEKKIQEYKAGTRNVAGMGMLMKGQVGSLSDEDIKAVAAYISSLK